MQLLTKHILSFMHLDSVNFQATGLPLSSTGDPAVPLERDGLREVKEPALCQKIQGEGRWSLFTEAFPRDNPEPLVLVEAVSWYSQPSEGY